MSEKCHHGTFKDEYVYGLIELVKALEKEVFRLRDLLGVVDMGEIDTEGTSEY